MKRVLVTGAAGLIGTAVVDHLLSTGVAVTGLVLEPAEDLPCDRVVVGDATDPAAVATALRDADAVIHLAAIPSPLRDPPEVVFGRNTLATFTVLNEAGEAGIERLALASSYAVCGLPFGVRPQRFPYLPIDTAMPLQITDAYALSKRTDEETAAMAHRRFGMTVVALRLPFVGRADERLGEVAKAFIDHPERGANDVWSYLDARDAARALVASLNPARPGVHTVLVAAEETLAPYPTESLLARYHRGVPHRPFPGRVVPIDLTPARELLNFTAIHPFPVAERPLP
jgi:nucleoside-diphosphate-sugar epimerase